MGIEGSGQLGNNLLQDQGIFSRPMDSLHGGSKAGGG